MMNSKDKGDIAEAKVTAKFIELGYTVLTPYGDNDRYDIVVDYENTFYKIQIKTAYSKKEGTISIQVCSSQYHRNGEKKSYKGDVDYIAAYNLKSENYYLIPIEECPKTEMMLRKNEPKNGQSQGINFAQEYEL